MTSGFESPAAHDHSGRFQYVFTEAGYYFALILKDCFAICVSARIGFYESVPYADLGTGGNTQ